MRLLEAHHLTYKALNDSKIGEALFLLFYLRVYEDG